MSDLNTIQEKLKEIIINKFNLKDNEEIIETTKFVEDLGAGSLDLVELVMQLEEDFDVEIPDEDFENVTTFGELVNLIISKK